MKIKFPWPPSVLRPNARPGHWAEKHNAAKKYKADCIITCRAANLKAIPPTSFVHLMIRFNPPDRSRRDLDGMLSSVKQMIDAISEAIKVDDSEFQFSISKGEMVEHGAVNVDIIWGAKVKPT